MLIASNFGAVCRMRPTSCAAIVKSILFLPSAVIDTAAMKYGCDMEEIVKQKLKKDIKPCRLFIDSNNQQLGASSGGLLERRMVQRWRSNILFLLKI